MSDGPIVPNPDTGSSSNGDDLVPGEYVPAKELEKLPQEMRVMVSVMAAVIKSTTGPDPETAKIVAQSEMHEETCRLDGYKESIRARDNQNQRDHEFRNKRLNHETLRGMVVAGAAVAGLIFGGYLLATGNKEVGTPILVASFTALLTGKNLLGKDKD